MSTALTISAVVMTTVMAVHRLVISTIPSVIAIIAVIAIVTVPSAVVMMVALAGQIATFLEFR